MFTLGIFTTHIPYIVMVVFYAFFWMIGVDKASAGEFTSDEDSALFRLSATETVTDISLDFSYDLSEVLNQGLMPKKTAHLHIALQRIIHNGYYLFKYFPGSVCAALFSRPPPLSL